MTEVASWFKNSKIDWSKFYIGIPCKYSEVAIIPKHIYSVVESELICKCRGGEMVLLELIQEYTDNNAIDADLGAMYGIDIGRYTQIWEKRVDALNLRQHGWVKVKMNKLKEESL